jgi:hypothetical protein
LDAVDAGVVEFGSGDFQRVEIAVDAVTVTIYATVYSQKNKINK